MNNVNEEILPFVKITKSFMQIPNESTDNTTPFVSEYQEGLWQENIGAIWRMISIHIKECFELNVHL